MQVNCGQWLNNKIKKKEYCRFDHTNFFFQNSVKMLSLLEYLPVELVGVKVLDFLSLREIIMLERASCSKECYQHFLDLIPLCQSLELPTDKQKTKSVLVWFAKRKCKINCKEYKDPREKSCPLYEGPSSGLFRSGDRRSSDQNVQTETVSRA